MDTIFTVLMGGQLFAYAVVIIVALTMAQMSFMRGSHCWWWAVVWGSLLARDVFSWAAVAMGAPPILIGLAAALPLAVWRFSLVAAIASLARMRAWRPVVLYAIAVSALSVVSTVCGPLMALRDSTLLHWASSLLDGLLVGALFTWLAWHRDCWLRFIVVLCALPLAISDALWGGLWYLGQARYEEVVLGSVLGGTLAVFCASMGTCVFVLGGLVRDSQYRLAQTELALGISAQYLEAEVERINGRNRAHGSRLGRTKPIAPRRVRAGSAKRSGALAMDRSEGNTYSSSSGTESLDCSVAAGHT